jgi:hypothetical protein
VKDRAVVGFVCPCGAATIHAAGWRGRLPRWGLCTSCIERRLRLVCITASIRVLTNAHRLHDEEWPEDADADEVASDLYKLAEELSAASERDGGEPAEGEGG